MVSPTRPRVVLIGPPASGKTKIGRILAKRLGEPFLDTDTILRTRYGPIPDVFRDQGEAWFRGREAEVVAECLSGPGVLSLGGGAIITASTRDALAGHNVVGLVISDDAVAARLDNTKRPLLVHGLDSWKALVASRQHWYDEVAQNTVDVSHRAIEDVAEEIAQWLESKSV